MFGGVSGDTYTNFEPRPLAWATDDPAAIQLEISWIPSEDWAFLLAVKDKVPDMKKDKIALFSEEHELLKVI